MKQLSSARQLLAATAKIYRQKCWEFMEVCLLALVGAFPLVIVYSVYYLINYSDRFAAYRSLDAVLAVAYFLAAIVAAYFALSTVIGCFLVANDDKRSSAWQIILSTRHYFWHFLMVWIMCELALMIASLPEALVFKLIGGNWLSVMMVANSGLALALGALVAIFVIPVIWVVVNYFWSFFALMEDGFQNISALKRSRQLIKGRTGQVVNRLLAFVSLWVIFYLLATWHLHYASSSWLYSTWSILMKLLLIFSNFVFAPSLIIFGRLIYKELVATRAKTNLERGGSSVLVKMAVLCGVVFLLCGLINTVSTMSSKSVMTSKMIDRDRQRLVDIKTIQAGLAAYYQEQGKYPEWLVMGQPLAAGDKVYMEQLPSNIKSADGECPVDYEYTYYQVASGQDYVLTYCLGAGLSDDQNKTLLTAGEHKLSQSDLIFN